MSGYKNAVITVTVIGLKPNPASEIEIKQPCSTSGPRKVQDGKSGKVLSVRTTRFLMFPGHTLRPPLLFHRAPRFAHWLKLKRRKKVHPSLSQVGAGCITKHVTSATSRSHCLPLRVKDALLFLWNPICALPWNTASPLGHKAAQTVSCECFWEGQGSSDTPWCLSLNRTAPSNSSYYLSLKRRSVVYLSTRHGVLTSPPSASRRVSSCRSGNTGILV